MKIKMKQTYLLNFYSQFNFSTYRIGRSVMKRLRMPHHTDTDVRLRTPAVLLQEDPELLVTTHEPFIIKKVENRTNNIAEDAM